MGSARISFYDHNAIKSRPFLVKKKKTKQKNKKQSKNKKKKTVWIKQLKM